MLPPGKQVTEPAVSRQRVHLMRQNRLELLAPREMRTTAVQPEHLKRKLPGQMMQVHRVSRM